MQGYNVIAVFSPDRQTMLMCKRIKDPYKGLYNFVGGKIERGEDGYSAAYRELYEETGIDKTDIRLVHLMDFSYPLCGEYVEVYAGGLKRETALREEKNPLLWISADDNFFDMTKYAGEGNIGHIMEHIKIHETEIFD
ncbi:MAG: NUDIX domain-containing protein [Oscillospiraceae bacterium]|nr:NUDIX domain-containing protein [Oscillospiraceae bacterium]